MKSLVRRRNDVARPLMVAGLLLLIGALAHAEEMTWEQFRDLPDSSRKEANIWKGLGFSPNEAADWRQFPNLLNLFTSEQIVALRDAGCAAGDVLSMVVDAQAARFRGREFEWIQESIKWKKAGFDSTTTDEWRREGFDAATAVEWLRAGLWATRAGAWRAMGYSASAAAQKLKQICPNGEVDPNAFIANPNVFANKGKCVYLEPQVEQMTESNAGLFEVSGRRIFLRLDRPFTEVTVKGLARIDGNYSYISAAGLHLTVPSLRMVFEYRPAEPKNEP